MHGFFTLNVYGHVTDRMKWSSAERMKELSLLPPASRHERETGHIRGQNDHLP